MIAREQVKILLAKEDMSLTKLAEKLTEFTGKKYSQQNLSNKLLRDTLKFSEFYNIAQVLGYNINLEKLIK